MERIILLSAIWDTDLDEELCFTVNSIHEPYLYADDPRCWWLVILTPNAGRMYFLDRICALIRTLDIEVAVYTDINYPGCIVIN